VEVDVVPLDVCSVVFGRPYMYMRDVIFMRRANKYHPLQGKPLRGFYCHKIRQNCKKKPSLKPPQLILKIVAEVLT
jgi:hypothetical protein